MNPTVEETLENKRILNAGVQNAVMNPTVEDTREIKRILSAGLQNEFFRVAKAKALCHDAERNKKLSLALKCLSRCRKVKEDMLVSEAWQDLSLAAHLVRVYVKPAGGEIESSEVCDKSSKIDSAMKEGSVMSRNNSN